MLVQNIDVSAIGPLRLAFSSDGNLNIAGYGSDDFAVFSPAGKLVRNLAFVGSTDVAIDVAGFVFAVCCSNESNSPSIFDPRGQIVHTIELDHPWGVA